MLVIRKEIRTALFLCLPYLLIVFFRYDLDRLFYHLHSHLGNPLLVLYLFTASIFIAIFFMHAAMEVMGNYKTYGFIAVWPLIIYGISLFNSFWNPVGLSSEVFRSPIVHRVLRKDKYGHAQMNMRKNGSLDIRYPASFGLADWEYGQWHKTQDTFYFKFESGKEATASDDMLSDTMVVDHGSLMPIHMPQDSAIKYKEYLFKIR